LRAGKSSGGEEHLQGFGGDFQNTMEFLNLIPPEDYIGRVQFRNFGGRSHRRVFS
jgi:hypothetical protein